MGLIKWQGGINYHPTLHRTWLVLGWVTVAGSKLSRHVASHWGWLSFEYPTRPQLCWQFVPVIGDRDLPDQRMTLYAHTSGQVESVTDYELSNRAASSPANRRDMRYTEGLNKLAI